jgi:hypothetical protein
MAQLAGGETAISDGHVHFFLIVFIPHWRRRRIWPPRRIWRLMPGDEASVSAAVRAYPERFFGYFMVNPLSDDALAQCVGQRFDQVNFRIQRFARRLPLRAPARFI